MRKRVQVFPERGYETRKTSSGNTVDRKSTRLNSSHSQISYAVFCLKKKTTYHPPILHVSLVARNSTSISSNQTTPAISPTITPIGCYLLRTPCLPTLVDLRTLGVLV